MHQSKIYWNNRYVSGGNSGYGSYGEQLAKKLKWLRGLSIASIAEIGCGDFNFGKNLLKLYPNAYYVGYDISEAIVERNQRDYPQYEFTTDPSRLVKADLTLCIDVLFHVLDDTEYELLLDNLEANWKDYLAITAYERNDPHTAPHVKIRTFDYKRFGKPLIREIDEEDGKMYFYLFKKRTDPAQHDIAEPVLADTHRIGYPTETNYIIPKIDLQKVSCCLLTKEESYPTQILDTINQYSFGEVLILTNSNNPYRKYELFKRAKFDLIYYQDDDAICPIEQLAALSKPDMINVAMKPGHFEAYKNSRATMGLGWGSIFPKKLLKSLKKYTDTYGEDAVFRRETERILTYLNFPQNRLILPIVDLPTAMAPDRLWRQPYHDEYKTIAETRCAML